VKVLVIAFDAQVRDALETQLAIRDRRFSSVADEWFAPVVPSAIVAPGAGSTQPSLVIPEDIGMVVNALSLESIELGSSKRLMDNLALLVQACERQKLPLLHLSSSQVFEGHEGGRHREETAIAPVSQAGVLLAEMEGLVRQGCSQHIIVRTGPLFSAIGENLLTALLGGFNRGETLLLSSSGNSCPVYAGDLARVISAIIDQLSCGAQCWGSYHYCSSDPVSHHRFAETVLAAASQYTEAGSQSLQAADSLDNSWPQPLLNCGKILNTFGIKQLPWRSFVAPSVKDIYQQPKDDSQ
jgi:dTDP-4-dehydrorhamnose reductase